MRPVTRFTFMVQCVIQREINLKGLALDGHSVNNIRYADDTVMIADGEKDAKSF